jgi:hypothetical protein
VYAVGGGVYLGFADFTMSGGTISGNTADSKEIVQGWHQVYAYGGGVFVKDATFTMSGGTISGNTANASDAFGGYYFVYAHGGGVCIDYQGIFTMSDGTISGNTANSKKGAQGGGVYNGGGFYFKGGEIKENVLKYNGSYGQGGGIYYYYYGAFVMSGGAVVTPNPAGSPTLSASGEYTDTRNSVYLGSGPVEVYGTLTGNNNGIAALLDIEWWGNMDNKRIRASDTADAPSGTWPVLHDYPYQGSNAPTDRFDLGYFYANGCPTDIATGQPVIDPSASPTTPMQWNPAGDGTLMDKP